MRSEFRLPIRKPENADEYLRALRAELAPDEVGS